MEIYEISSIFMSSIIFIEKPVLPRKNSVSTGICDLAGFTIKIPKEDAVFTPARKRARCHGRLVTLRAIVGKPGIGWETMHCGENHTEFTNSRFSRHTRKHKSHVRFYKVTGTHFGGKLIILWNFSKIMELSEKLISAREGYSSQ